MNKPKKAEPKKFLVRNTEQPVSVTKCVVEDFQEPKEKPKNDKKTAPKPLKVKIKEPLQNFQCPELNSALGIAKKMEIVEKTKSIRSKSTSELAFDEKVTRQVNFPYQKKLYKGLVPLNFPAKSAPVLAPRAPLPLKDIEPKLSDFVETRQAKEFIHQSSDELPDPPELQKIDNLRLYKVLQNLQM